MYSDDSSLLCPDNKDLNSTFWLLWQKHQDYLYCCCVKWMGNTSDAEDALSRAMLKAWDKIINSTVEIKNIKAWLSKLTYNLCMDIHRERHRSMEHGDSWEVICEEHEEILVNKKEETPFLVA